MATSKKKATGAKAAKADQPDKKALPKAGSPAKTKWFMAVLAVVMIGLAAEGYYMAKSQSSENIELVHVGPILLSDTPSVRSLKGDSEGNFLRLNGRDDVWRLIKYGPSLAVLVEFKPKNKEQGLVNAVGVAADEQGNVYVAQNNGEVKLLDKNLAFVAAVKTGLSDVTDMDVDAEGRMHLVSRSNNKVGIYSREGAAIGEYGTPDTKGGGLASPTRIVIQPKTGRIVILEVIATGTRVRMFKPDLSPDRAFIIAPEKMRYVEYTGMGVAPNDLVVFNDGEKSVVFFSLKKGKFYGSAQRTQDNQIIISPAGLGVNKWNGDIYIDFIPGAMKCTLPEKK